MKYKVVVKKDGGVEVHSLKCKEIDWTDYFSDADLDAPSPFGAAIAAQYSEAEALNDVVYFECLGPDYEAPEDRPRGRRPRKRAVPFDPAGDDDEDIINAVKGAKLVWENSLTGGEESAQLYPDGPWEKNIQRGVTVTTFPHRQTKITVTSDGRRVLGFIDAGGTGFRACALDSIVSVT